ncbi:MAG: ComF family protein [Ostreibacterium sp.]
MSPWLKVLSRQINYSAHVLVGARCAGCQKIGKAVLCQSCRDSITKPRQMCEVCGCSLKGKSYIQRCQNCITRPPAYESLQYIGNYDGVLSNLITAAKLGRQVEAITALRQLMRGYSQVFQRYSSYAILPMPIPKGRFMQRGFNLPSIIAQDLVRNYPLSLVPSTAVKLPFFVQKQAKLTLKQRQKNQHLYQIYYNLPKKIVIIDDILTTGNTMNALAKALRQEGVESIAAWAVARAQQR